MPEPAKDAAMGIFRELKPTLGRRPVWDAMPRVVRRIGGSATRQQRARPL